MTTRVHISRFVGMSVALLVSVFTALSSRAQVWDEIGSTEALTGLPFDWTDTAGIVYANNGLWYLDYNGASSPPAFDLGAATVAYRYPVSWHTASTHTFFGDDPGSSPVGGPVTVTVSVDAVAFEVATPSYDGYVVGLIITYECGVGESPMSAELEVFAPGELLPDKPSAKKSVKRLAATQSPSPANPGPVGEPLSCEEECALLRETARKNAFDNYVTNSNLCAISIGPGFGAGCAAGVAVCGWLMPPFSTLGCCIGGGILGAGAGYGTCLYGVTELYDSALRGIERDYRDCMLLECGIVIADE